MKISCDACQAKYSISDDKVQGKVFKIRCKKCSHIIVVRGVAAAPPEPAPLDEAPDAVWHLVVDQEQVGPLTVAEVEQRFAAGEINIETFGWREGFADWLPLGEIDAFAMITDSSRATEASDPVSAMFSTSSAPAAASADRFAAASSAGGATETHAQKLRGERNESSVLFSLSNLAQIAENTPRRTPAATPASATPNAASGAATGEGSGLIDIRSMASAYLGSAPGGVAAKVGKSPNTPSIGSMDDLPVFGGGGFAEPAVIMPTLRPTGDRKVMYLMIAAVSLLAILATVLIVMLVGGDKPTKVAAVTPAQTPKSAPVVEEPAKPEVAPVAAPQVASAPEVPAPRPEKRVEKKPTGDASARLARPPAVQSLGSPPVQSLRPPAVPAPAPAAGACDEVECVLNGGACCARFLKKPNPTPKPEPTNTNLPDSLDRRMISTGVDAVKNRVMACGNKSPAKGKVLIKVSVASNGSVKGVAIETTPDAGLGACVAANMQKAAFASTKSGGSFRVPFTF